MNSYKLGSDENDSIGMKEINNIFVDKKINLSSILYLKIHNFIKGHDTISCKCLERILNPRYRLIKPSIVCSFLSQEKKKVESKCSEDSLFCHFKIDNKTKQKNYHRLH